MLHLTGILPLLLGFFMMLGLGMTLRKSKRVPSTTPDVLTTIVVDVTLPALVLHVFDSQKLSLELWKGVVAAYCALFGTLAIAILLGRLLKRSKPKQGTMALCSSFSNTGFMGIPLFSVLFVGVPGAAVTAVVVDAFTCGILLYTFAIWTAMHFGNHQSIDWKNSWKMFFTPVILCCLIGIALNLNDIKLPIWLAKAAETMGKATAPMVFLAIGMRLDLKSIKQGAADIGIVTILKLIVCPAIALAVVCLLKLTGIAGQITVLQSAMPTSMMSSIIAARYGCNAEIGSGAVALTTAFTIVTLPLLMSLLHYIGI